MSYLKRFILYKYYCRYLTLLLTSFIFYNTACSQPIVSLELKGKQLDVPISENYAYFIDKEDSFTSRTVLNQKFESAHQHIPVYPVGTRKVWIKFTVLNQSEEQNLFLDLRYTNLSKVVLHEIENDNNLRKIGVQGNQVRLKHLNTIVPNFIFNLNTPKNVKKTYLLEVSSNHPIILPLYICNNSALEISSTKQNIIISLYVGVLCAMMIYNFFLFITVKDKIYLYYVIYIITILFAQLTIAGYSYMFIWPSHEFINSYAVVWTSNFSFIAAILFAIHFLQIKVYSKYSYRLFILIIGTSVADLLLNLLHFDTLSYTILNYNSLLTGIVVLATSITIARKGYKPAYLYFIAWSLLFISLILLALRNLDILPYNSLTAYVFYIGSATETVLLSIALADKINAYKKEKELSQAESLRISKENERLIQEQNIELEKRIAERTYDLEKTLQDLKDAQIQLVESEKMASLGQLTAGIAHEINNPINFVKSNVSPLQLDFQDIFELVTEYQKLHSIESGEQPQLLKKIKQLENKLDPDFLKEEIESLIGGIEEGAERTAEIVRGLRNFSRLDESEMKEVDIYENINSTLVLLRNTTPHYLKIRKHFEAKGEIECYPGKLNQVFMNILTNGIQAIKAKPVLNNEEYIDISVTQVPDHMRICISDTGTGMTEEVKKKIFDPFFTTKDVGEGTGLGMAIVFKIIEKHHGKITVHSVPGEGSTFTIEIPYMLKFVSATEMVEEKAD